MTTVLVLVLALLAARPESPDNAPRLSADVDVTGDGQPDKLTLEPVNTTGFRLTVGKAQVEAELPGVRGFTVIDLDASDKRQEVLVHAPSQVLSRYRLFRWENQTLQEIPLPPGTPSASGNGFLLCDVPVSGWLRRDKYRYDASQPAFTELPQDLYAVGLEFELHSELPIQMPPDTKGSLRKGTRVTLLAFKPAPGAARWTDAGGWYLLQPMPSRGQPARGLGWASAEKVLKAYRPEGQPLKSGPPELGSALTYVGVSATVARSFPLQLLPTGEAPAVAQLREGSTPALLATDGTWYLVQSETRLLGWVKEEVLVKGLSELRKGKPRDLQSSRFFLLQLQVLGRHPSPHGIVLNYTYASSSDTYYICADGSAVFDEEYQVTKHSWTLKGHVLHLSSEDELDMDKVIKGEGKYELLTDRESLLISKCAP